MNLCIKNGHIVDPATGRDEVGDVYVVDGKIADAMTGEYETIDASGKYVMPGFVDLHVHLREPAENISIPITAIAFRFQNSRFVFISSPLFSKSVFLSLF